jgi:hypothetical protein
MSHTLADEPDERPEDWEAELAPTRSSGRRTSLALVGLVLVAAGFVGGIVTTQQVGEGEETALPGGLELPDGVELPEGFELPTLAGSSVPGLGTPTGGGGTTGTVAVVDGSTLYLSDATGGTVVVELREGTRVRRMARGAVRDLEPGDEVTVTGPVDESGTVRARRIDETG